jgi:transcription elongation factor SPT5
MVDTGGVFVVRTRMIARVTAGGISGPRNNNGLGGMQNNRTAPGNFRVPGAPANRRDPLLQKKVTITSGPHKGYQGIVKSITDKGARVELNTNGRLVTVDRSKLRLQYVILTLRYDLIVLGTERCRMEADQTFNHDIHDTREA